MSHRRPGRSRTVRRKITRVLALEFDAGALYIAEAVRKARRSRVTRSAVVPLPEDGSVDAYDAQSSGGWIGRALKDAGFRSAPVVICVPRRKVILKSLTLPPGLADGELVSMVHLQLSKDLTFPVEEAIVDFATQTAEETADTGSSSRPRGTSVVVGAMKRDLVDFFRKQAAAAGLRLYGIGLRSYGNVRYLEHCGVVPEDADAGLICLQGYEVMVDVLERGQLAFSRAAAIEPSRQFRQHTGGGDDEFLAGHTSALTTEVIRTLQSYSHADRPAEIGHIFVGGATGLEEELVEQLSQRLRLPCERLDPSASMGLSDPEAVTAARACLGPMGLALAACDRPRLAIDFLRPKEPARNPRDGKLRKVLVTATCAAAVLAGAVMCNKYVSDKGQPIPDLEIQIHALEAKRKVSRRDRQRGQVVDGWVEGRGEWLDHWAYLSVVLPAVDDIYVTEVRTGAGGRVWLSVRARSGETLSTLDAKLRAAGYQVSPLAMTPTSDPFGYDFKTTVELIAERDARVEDDSGKTKTLREAMDETLALARDGTSKSPEQGEGREAVPDEPRESGGDVQ